MTAAIAVDHHVHGSRSRRARPDGLSRAVMLLSISMLRWARKRADRAEVTHEERVLLMRLAREQRVRENAHMVMRLF